MLLPSSYFISIIIFTGMFMGVHWINYLQKNRNAWQSSAWLARPCAVGATWRIWLNDQATCTLYFQIPVEKTVSTTVQSKFNKSSQSHLGRVRRYPRLGECTLPLHVLDVACTMRNEALRDVTGALRGLMERNGSDADRYGTLRNVTERCVTLQRVTEALQIVTERYVTVTENIDFAHH